MVPSNAARVDFASSIPTWVRLLSLFAKKKKESTAAEKRPAAWVEAQFDSRRRGKGKAEVFSRSKKKKIKKNRSVGREEAEASTL